MTDTNLPGTEGRAGLLAGVDWAPLAVVAAAAVLALALIGSPSVWLTLTVAGLAMGMMIFIVASGLTLVFGLMDVLNFGHGAFVTVGAYLAFTILAVTTDLVMADSLAQNLAALLMAVCVAAAGAAALGFLFERIIVRRVYGDHLKQILITMGGMIIVEQVVMMIWGPQEQLVQLPETLRGAVPLGDAIVEKYRLLVVVFGAVLFVLMHLSLTHTRLGLLIRAGVEDPEMIQALGYRIRRLFVGLFVAGSALAGFGGVMWVLYRGTLTADIGGELMILAFIVVIMGGLGSISGCFISAILVAMVANYVAYLVPEVAMTSTIVLLVAVISWRPRGLFPLTRR
ncbi:branched-chain amino acid ABC transporter permease [Futiania mangrovi]|uniref:Branched-chain amino acid ABC transporter permease n=1 Tax=Futiania mangrovi TaxID=2959716 RepID=A0A9J6PEI1_9PROT|nr:branched-chain amino acid ABC transporter permease [Futiania mangrovii]MCP1337829.1 branched-chain amino acid ABC transporter permease [Futiania mangrovii]